MLAKVFVFALFPFVVVNAAPVGQRDLVDSVVSRATSAVGSLWHEATHGFAVGVMSAEASSVYQSATAVLGTATANVHVTVTTISSTPVVEVTSVGGPAITLATLSVPGQQGTHHSHPVATTTFAGHTFLVPSSVSHSSHSHSSQSHSSHSHASSSSSSSVGGSSTASSNSASSTASSSSASSTSTSAFPTSNGAVGMQALSVSKPMIMGAVTMLTSLLGGALIAL